LDTLVITGVAMPVLEAAVAAAPKIAATAALGAAAYKYATTPAESSATGAEPPSGSDDREWVAELENSPTTATGEIRCFTLGYSMRDWNGDINHPVLFAQYQPSHDTTQQAELIIGIINVRKNAIRTVTFAGDYTGNTVIVQNSEIVPSVPTFELPGNKYVTEEGVAEAKSKTAKKQAGAAAPAASRTEAERDAVNEAYKQNMQSTKSIAWFTIPGCKALTAAAGGYMGYSLAETYLGPPGAYALSYVSVWAAKKWSLIMSGAGATVGAMVTNAATSRVPAIQNIVGTYTAQAITAGGATTMYYARQLSNAAENAAIKKDNTDENAGQHLMATSYKEGLYKKAELKYKRVQALAPDYRIDRETFELLTSWHYLATACVFGAVHSNRHNVSTAGLGGWQTGVWPVGGQLNRAVQIENYRASFSDVDSVADAQVVDAVDNAERGTVALVALSAAVLDGDGPARAAAQLLGVTKWDTQWTPAKTAVRGDRTSGYKIPDGRTRSTVENYDLEMYRVSQLANPTDGGTAPPFVYVFNFPEPGMCRLIEIKSEGNHKKASDIFRELCKDEGGSAAPSLSSVDYPRVAAIAALWEPAAVVLPVDDVGSGSDHKYDTAIKHDSLKTVWDKIITNPRMTWGVYDEKSDTAEFEQNRRRFVRAMVCARGVGFTFRPTK
jgi:hypothetical protein